MSILIIETGIPPQGLDKTHGTYPDMFVESLARHDPTVGFTTQSVLNGESLPAPATLGGILITGSPAGVYEPHPWIEPLARFVREAVAARRPVVGVCFGHQLISHALGGKVEKSHKGWGVGVHTYHRVAQTPYFAPATERVSCVVSHQDQVVALPPGARRLAGSPFCPNAVIDYGDGAAFSMQPHPEFTHQFASDLMEVRKASIDPDARALAKPTLEHSSDRDILLASIVAYLERGRK